MQTERPKCTVICEPQLGKRGLHPLIGTKESKKEVKKYINFLQYADGTNDIKKISEILEIGIKECLRIYKKLYQNKLIKISK